MWFPRSHPDGVSGTDGAFRMRYRGLRRLLAINSQMLELMADLEADLYHLLPGEYRIRQPITRLLDGTLILAENLNVLTGDKYKRLYDSHRKIENSVREYLKTSSSYEALPLLTPLHEASMARVREVGGKASNLGELRLAMPDVVPEGFVITTAAFRLFLDENNLHEPIRKQLKDISLVTDRDPFKERTASIRALIEKSPIPRKIADAIADGVMQFPMPWPTQWAVRSSAVGEDGRLSFAGQFDSFLNVPTNELQAAYKKVLASRYTDRAVLYRLIGGFTEVGTPMAVLFLPMVEARSAGVMYTRDPREEQSDRMLINSVKGLAENMVRGHGLADTFIASRSEPGKIFEQRLGAGPVLLDAAVENGDRKSANSEGKGPSLKEEEIEKLVQTGLKVEGYFGRPQDIEWAIDENGSIKVVQSRRLRIEDRRIHGGQTVEVRTPFLEGGTTIFPGRAVGPAFVAASIEDLGKTPQGVILIVRQATPEISSVLPFLAGIVAEHGNPGGHAATLIREFGVPGIFGMEGAMERIGQGKTLSLDATHRKVFEGSLWPEVLERVRARIQQARTGKPAGPLQELILTLNLTDPLSPAFRPGNCKSIHDIIRFTHEKAVAAIFELGDEAAGQKRLRSWRMAGDVPLNFLVLDLGGSVPEDAYANKELRAEDIRSIPFQAIWSGMTDPEISWAGRKSVSAGGFMSVMARSMNDPSAPVRKLGDVNYIIAAPEYLNMNARLAYHFAMVDSLISNVPENNYVNFRFRGGGAGTNRRELRARFLSEVLLRSNFSVDRRGDLVTAWMRRYPREVSEKGLALIGRLMGCARQLDMLMDNEASLKHYIEKFIKGDYGAFA